MTDNATANIHSIVRRNLVFVHGKGGVGKSCVSEAIAWALSDEGARVLLVEFEDPTREPGELKTLGPKIWHLNADASLAFEEYSALKIDKLSHGILSGLGSFGHKGMTRLFTQNKLIKYLAKAAPGIHELVLLGKVWHERNHYDHVIVDLPSTGYGLAMFQSTANFVKLFGGGPISQDAQAMLNTFRDPAQTGNIIVALPEEMPLREAIDLNGYLRELFPSNPAAFLVNRRFPRGNGISQATLDPAADAPSEWTSPYASSARDYVDRRRKLESHNLKLWVRSGIPYGEVDYLPPDKLEGKSGSLGQAGLTRRLSEQMRKRGYV